MYHLCACMYSRLQTLLATLECAIIPLACVLAKLTARHWQTGGTSGRSVSGCSSCSLPCTVTARAPLLHTPLGSIPHCLLPLPSGHMAPADLDDERLQHGRSIRLVRMPCQAHTWAVTRATSGCTTTATRAPRSRWRPTRRTCRTSAPRCAAPPARGAWGADALAQLAELREVRQALRSAEPRRPRTSFQLFVMDVHRCAPPSDTLRSTPTSRSAQCCKTRGLAVGPCVGWARVHGALCCKTRVPAIKSAGVGAARVHCALCCKTRVPAGEAQGLRRPGCTARCAAKPGCLRSKAQGLGRPGCTARCAAKPGCLRVKRRGCGGQGARRSVLQNQGACD